MPGINRKQCDAPQLDSALLAERTLHMRSLTDTIRGQRSSVRGELADAVRATGRDRCLRRRHVAGKLIGTVILAVLLTVAVVGPTIAHAASNSSSAWSTARTWPYAQTQGGPAAGDVQRRSLRCLGWANPKSRGVVLGLDGFQLQRGANDPAAGTRHGPALAVFGGLLWAAWVGTGSPAHLWYATFNGTNWSAQAEVPTALAAKYSAPAFAAYDGKLY